MFCTGAQGNFWHYGTVIYLGYGDGYTTVNPFQDSELHTKRVNFTLNISLVKIILKTCIMLCEEYNTTLWFQFDILKIINAGHSNFCACL